MIAASEDKEQNCGENEHEEIYHLKTFWGNGAKNSYWDTHNDTDVENVAANNIAND